MNICHPHGFLPLSTSHWKKSDFIIFDKKSYDERLDPINPSPWWRFLEYLLNAKQWLFLGIGEEDPTLGPLLNGVKANLSKSANTNRKILGFWAFHTHRKSPDHITKINDYGCVPLYFDNYSEIPEFLLRIRQVAAEIDLS